MKISSRMMTFMWLLLTTLCVTVISTPATPEVPTTNDNSSQGAIGTDISTFLPIGEFTTVADGETATTSTEDEIKPTTQIQTTKEITTMTEATTTATTTTAMPPATTPTATTTVTTHTTMKAETTNTTPLQTTIKKTDDAGPKDQTTQAPAKMSTKPHRQTVPQNATKKGTGLLPGIEKDSFTAKVILPIAAGIVLAVFIVLIGCSVRSCLEKDGNSNTRKRLMEHDMSPTDRVMLLADSSEDEF